MYKIGSLPIIWIFIFIIAVIMLYQIGVTQDIYTVTMSTLTSVVASIAVFYMVELNVTQHKVHDLHTAHLATIQQSQGSATH